MSFIDVRACAAVALVCSWSTSVLADTPPPPAPASTSAAGGPAPAPSLVLDWRAILARARADAPFVRTRAARLGEIEARRVDAEVYPRQNPVLEASAGPRFEATDPRSVVLAFGLAQAFELGAAPSARQRRVDAELAAAEATIEVETREGLRKTAVTFVRALWAESRVDLARQSEAMADQALVAVQKRKDAGDVSSLQINVAKAARARAAATTRELEGVREVELGTLRYLLGLTPGSAVDLRGSIADSVLPPRAGDAAPVRPEIAALDAELRAARADEDLASALGAPTLTLGARYEFEDDRIHTVVGTLGITLPIFERGQGQSAEARSRADRKTVEKTLESQRIAHEAATRNGALARHVAAAEAFGALGGIDTMQRNVDLANRGFSAGEMSLTELLLYRRELVETETQHLDQLLELRLAEIEALAASGGLK